MVAAEVMVPNTAVRSLIRENKLHQIPSAMLLNQQETGMVTLNQSLEKLVRMNLVEVGDAIAATPEPSELMKALGPLSKKAS